MKSWQESFGLNFRAHDLAGRVQVNYRVNDDPRALGYPRLKLDAPAEMALGFPVVEAVVEYDGEGYLQNMGWVQVVRARHNGDAEAVVDRAPNMVGTEQPFATWGPCPRFFDAPSTTASPVAWRADTFLTVSPDLLMSRVVQPICSFQWGYDVARDGKVTPRVARPQELGVWSEVVRVLEADCAGWVFGPEDS